MWNCVLLEGGDFINWSALLNHCFDPSVPDQTVEIAWREELKVVRVEAMDGFDVEFLPSGNFNRLIGNGWVKTMIEQGASIDEIAKKYEAEQKRFMNIRKKYLLY